MLLVILVTFFFEFTNVCASSVSVPLGTNTNISLILTLGVNAGILDESDLISLGLSDSENLANAEYEQQYLEEMIEYYESYGGSPSKIAYITADGSIVTLEETLQAVTSMDIDEYIEMRKGSNSPTPSPGTDWGAIFIDAVSGGLMDFLASFLNDKADEADYVRPYTMYTGDSDYIDRSTGAFTGFVESDGLLYGKVVKGKFYYDFSTTVSSEHASTYRMAILIYDNPAYMSSFNSSGNSVGYGSSDAVISGNRLEIFDTYYPSVDSAPTPRKLSLNVNTRYNFLSPSYFAYACGPNNYLSFTHLSTNLPVFTDADAMAAYLKGETTANDCNVRPQTAINDLCNNYKNKVVTLTSVDDYGVTPTPTPSPTPKPTSTPTPSPTPTPTPFPTWSGEGPENFTTYNFYTEVSNSFVNVQTTLNNISQSITNIFNFFVIDTEEVSQEINSVNVLPTSKFKDFVATFGNLKNTFSNETQDVLNEAGVTNQFGISYPVIKVQCPKILLDFVPDNPSVVLYENNVCYLILCDCSKYATYFIKVRGFLKACIWFGMIFYLMRELKPVITLSD